MCCLLTNNGLNRRIIPYLLLAVAELAVKPSSDTPQVHSQTSARLARTQTLNQPEPFPFEVPSDPHGNARLRMGTHEPTHRSTRTHLKTPRCTVESGVPDYQLSAWVRRLLHSSQLLYKNRMAVQGENSPSLDPSLLSAVPSSYTDIHGPTGVHTDPYGPRWTT